MRNHNKLDGRKNRLVFCCFPISIVVKRFREREAGNKIQQKTTAIAAQMHFISSSSCCPLRSRPVLFFSLNIQATSKQKKSSFGWWKDSRVFLSSFTAALIASSERNFHLWSRQRVFKEACRCLSNSLFFPLPSLRTHKKHFSSGGDSRGGGWDNNNNSRIKTVAKWKTSQVHERNINFHLMLSAFIPFLMNFSPSAT